MGLEILVDSTDGRLTSLAAVKLELGIASSATSADARLDALILRAGDEASRYVGYPLGIAKYRETLAGYGTRRLMLSRTPIRAVPGLYFGTDTGDATQIASTEFAVDAAPGFLTRPQGWDWTVPAAGDVEIRPNPGQELEPWLADYVAGYTLGGISTADALWSTEKGTTSTGRSLPYDIEGAIVARAARVYTGAAAESASGAVESKTVGDLRISYATGGGTSRASASSASDPAFDALKPYRRSA